MKKKMMMALALAGSLWLGGTAMAMDVNVNVDSATKGMPGKVESTAPVPIPTAPQAPEPSRL